MATNKVTTNVIDMSGNTGGLVWAKGTKAQRPTGVAGDLRLNTTDNRLEYKDNSEWKRFSEGAATPSVDFQADFLVVAGGGPGQSGGGGAGGLRTSFGSTSGGGSSNESKLPISLSTSYTVTVGAGGAVGSSGTKGGDSVLATVTSAGGGQGGRQSQNNSSFSNGGCGGGQGRNDLAGPYTGTVNQGFGGGQDVATTFEAGGGGGTGQIGQNGVGGGAAGNGGNGTAISITGSSVTYGGGGGGTGESATASGTGGTGGGGNGSTSTGSAGTANTGGGGGGGVNLSTHGDGGAGGSGIVIVRYPNTYTLSAGSGLTSSTTTDGSDKVTTFTAGTDTISFS